MTKGVRSVFHVFRFVRHIPVIVYIIVVVVFNTVIIVVIVVELIHRFTCVIVYMYIFIFLSLFVRGCLQCLPFDQSFFKHIPLICQFYS